MTFLETLEDMKWLYSTHVPPLGYKFATIIGNEDCPVEIHLYIENNIKCKPTVLKLNRDTGGYIVATLGRQPRGAAYPKLEVGQELKCPH